MRPEPTTWEPVALYRNHTTAELVALDAAIRTDPANIEPGDDGGRLWLFTDAACRKLDALAWALTHRRAARHP